jgi:phosphoribosylamine--glycine ligase
LTSSETEQILDTIIRPTVEATRFTGFLYAGLMLTKDGPKLLEFNVRMGDPEAQPLMCQITGEFPEILLSAAHGQMGMKAATWRPGCSSAVVLAAEGYPAKPTTGDPITGIAEAMAMGAQVFHAGTKVDWGGTVTAGGRVLAVTATGPTLDEALKRTYAAVERIHFRGMQFRTDIGRALGKQLPDRI